MVTEKQQKILDLLVRERELQDRRWGEQNHKLAIWALVLGEEVGEVNKCILEMRNAQYFATEATMTPYNLLEELLQVAAVCIATIEYLERQKLIDLNGEVG